jgi:enoyl-CoA hydratase/carnithine racemase
MTEFVHVEQTSGVLTLTLKRPEKKNALTNAMYAALADGLERAENEESIRVVLFQGDGDSFTAGNDLADFSAAATRTANEERQSARFIRGLARATKPLVAAVQGNAVGVGTTMLLHCDLVFLADNAKLATPFVNLALVPEAASSLLLPLRVGYVRAYQMFALGEPIDAQTALAWGIANAVVPAEDLRSRARDAAEVLVTRPAGSLMHTKQLMRDAQAMTRQLDRELSIFSERLTSNEAKEAFQAFAERRKPNFANVEG